jgi:alpha-amylase
MASVCLYFKVHQPYRLTGKDENLNQHAIYVAADQCYLPANEIMLELIEKHQFKISFSISGTMIELLRQYRPDVVESLRRLVQTGCVEILGETYYHSLSSLHSINEWKRQVQLHAKLVQDVFGITPKVYRNTELIYHNDLAGPVAELGFTGLLCEGVTSVLQGRSPNHLYHSPGKEIRLLLRNAQLSDDIAFRFDDHRWSEHPLTADKFAEWLHSHPADTSVISLFMDYETFGIYKKSDTGIFDFLKALPAEVLKDDRFRFSTPSEVLKEYSSSDAYDVTRTISWEDRGEAACVWSENMMQHNMLRKIYSLEKMVTETGCKKTIAEWARLQSADHFYYMTHENEKYRNPYSSVQEAFEQYNRIINEFEISLINKNLEQLKKSSRLRSTALGFF